MLYLIFSGQPKAVQSFRYNLGGQKYEPSDVTDWKNWIRLQAREQVPPDFVPFKGPISISIRFCFAPLKNFNKKKRMAIATNQPIYKTTKPEKLNKLMDGYISALTETLWITEHQIAKVDSEKVYGVKAGTELWLKELEQI